MHTTRLSQAEFIIQLQTLTNCVQGPRQQQQQQKKPSQLKFMTNVYSF